MFRYMIQGPAVSQFLVPGLLVLLQRSAIGALITAFVMPELPYSSL